MQEYRYDVRTPSILLAFSIFSFVTGIMIIDVYIYHILTIFGGIFFLFLAVDRCFTKFIVTDDKFIVKSLFIKKSIDYSKIKLIKRIKKRHSEICVIYTENGKIKCAVLINKFVLGYKELENDLKTRCKSEIVELFMDRPNLN